MTRNNDKPQLLKYFKIKLKILNILLFMLIFCFLYLNESYANTTGTVFLTSDKQTVEINEEIEITLNIENTKTAAFTSYLNFDNSKLEYISGPENTNIIENCIISVWYDTTGGNESRQGELAKYKFRAKESGIANFIIDGEFYTQAGQLIQTNFKEVQVQIGNEESLLQIEAKKEQGTNTQKDNSSLKNLRLNIPGIVPDFKKDIYEYYLTVSNDVNDIEVLAIPENSNATIEVTGNLGLKEGLNIIEIKVLSEDKTQEKKYIIQVTKTANLEQANTNLETLAIENTLLNFVFDNSITHYNVQVSNTVSNLNVLAIPENENATVNITGKDNLQDGNNEIIVTVIAQNGYTKKEYVINAYKRSPAEEQAYLEEQKENQQELEEAYEIEKIQNAQINNIEGIVEERYIEDDEETLNSANKREIFYILVVVLVILIIVISIWLFRKKHNK